MPEKTKAEIIIEKCESDVKSLWVEDQQEKSYYYDDSYGYEVYNPEDDEDADEDQLSK